MAAFNKKVAKAQADLQAGRNLPEAVSIFHWTKNKEAIKKLVAMYAALANERNREGERFTHPDLGVLVHDGTEFVGKSRTLLYPRGRVEVFLDGELSEKVASEIWKAFRKRERKLKAELEKAIAGEYERLRSDVDWLKLKPLKRPSDIWKTLSAPSISIGQERRRRWIRLGWSASWEPEHGVTIYLTPDAKVDYIE